MVEYARKFGFSKETVRKWQSEPFFLEGKKDVLVILVHGWSLTSRQMLSLGKYLNTKGYNVSLPLLKGHGSRPEDLEGLDWRDWVQDIVQEIRKHKKTGKYKKIIIGGTSMGGNVCLLASLQEDVDGIITIGTPVHFKNHFLIKLTAIFLPLFKKYIKKRRPYGVKFKAEQSYQYFPTSNINQVLLLVRKAVFSLSKIKAPILIFQTSEDFFISKYSAGIIYTNVSSKIKKISWIITSSDNHVPQGDEVKRMFRDVDDFMNKLGC